MNVSRSNFTLSKTEEFGSAIDSECPTNEYNSDEEEGEGHIMRPDETKRAAFKPLTGFALIDARYLYPFFTRRVTREEFKTNRHQMRQLTAKWYKEVSLHAGGNSDVEENTTF